MFKFTYVFPDGTEEHYDFHNSLMVKDNYDEYLETLEYLKVNYDPHGGHVKESKHE